MAGDWPGMQEAMPWAYAGGAGGMTVMPTSPSIPDAEARHG